MLATAPPILEDFALGFSLTEGIVMSAVKFRYRGVESELGITLRVEIAAASFARLKERRRSRRRAHGLRLVRCGEP